MPEVRYVANLSATDGTGELHLKDHRVLVLGGGWLEVSDEELGQIRGRYSIEVREEPVVTVSVVQPEPDADAVPEVPAEPVTVGSDPSPSPTPDEGN